MIQIIQLPNTDFNRFKAILPQEIAQLIALQVNSVAGFQRFSKLGEGLFIVIKEEKVIGFGSIEQSPDAPPTAGIALVNHCYILPTERQKGYGNQLFRYLRQFAQNHFGLLQLNDTCPLRQRLGGLIDLSEV